MKLLIDDCDTCAINFFRENGTVLHQEDFYNNAFRLDNIVLKEVFLKRRIIIISAYKCI